jgi:hypothetical protein
MRQSRILGNHSVLTPGKCSYSLCMRISCRVAARNQQADIEEATTKDPRVYV